MSKYVIAVSDREIIREVFNSKYDAENELKKARQSIINEMNDLEDDDEYSIEFKTKLAECFKYIKVKSLNMFMKNREKKCELNPLEQNGYISHI